MLAVQAWELEFRHLVQDEQLWWLSCSPSSLEAEAGHSQSEQDSLAHGTSERSCLSTECVEHEEDSWGQPLLCICTQACTTTYRDTYVCIHMCTHTYEHAHTCIHKHQLHITLTYTHAHTQRYAHTTTYTSKEKRIWEPLLVHFSVVKRNKLCVSSMSLQEMHSHLSLSWSSFC